MLTRNNLIECCPHAGNHGDNEGVAHAEVAHAFRHAGAGPVVVKSLKPFRFFRREESELHCCRVLDNVGAAV